MTSKRANWLFFSMILTHIAVSLFLSFFGEFISIGITANFFLGEAILMMPALLFLLFSRQRPAGGEIAQLVQSGIAPVPQPARTRMFRRIKFSSILMIALCTFFIMPLVTVLNTLTLFFTDNAVAAVEGDILNVSFPVMLFMIGIFGPFCEEFVFRGIIYGSYAGCSQMGEAGGSAAGRSGGLSAILLSALTFGLMHMNFNQAVYAFVIGIFLAFLVEAAGSLWASVLCHMFFNSYQVVTMYLSKALLGSAYVKAVSEAAGELELTSETLQAALAAYLVIAAVATPIAGCCIAWIVKNEGRQEAMRALFHPVSAASAAQENMHGEAPQRVPLLTVPLVVAIVLCLGFMSLEFF